MAGKSVNRSRIHAFKSRVQPQIDKETSASEHSVEPTAAQVTPAKASRAVASDDHSGHATKGSKSIDRQRRSQVSSRLLSQVKQGLRFLAAPLVWLCLLAFCGGTGVAAFLWLTTLPPAPECQKLQPASVDSDKLYCAEQAARSGKVESLLAGLALVKHWSADHPLHNRADRAVKEWSKSLLALAQTKADQGDLTGAIALAKKIPANSPIHADVQTALLSWQKGQNQGKVIDEAIQTALKQQDWQTAAAQLQTLSSLDDQYARQNLSRLRQQLTTERAARQQLQQARQVAESAPDTAVIGRAIALAEQMKPGSYAHADAQVDLQTWGQFLLNRLTEQLERGDTAGAIATAQALPLSLPLPSVARDLVWLSRAQPLATRTFANQSSSVAQWQFWVTLFQIHQVHADSPLYAQMQPLIPKLERQSQDFLQIQLATALANLHQMPALQTAIGLMQTIAPGHPQRVYAQTLIAQWRKEMQQLEDRPSLAQAQQLAAAGTIPKLKDAIAQAQQIAPKRALRLEAQSAIAKWTRQIQTLEDRPLLNQAQALAKQQKLKDAIRTATKIRAGRSLYREAQAAINTWTNQIQLAEDQPILNEARALADRGSLTAAIDLAAKISPARSLYSDAQSAIARWSAQRDAIVTRRSAPRYEPPPAPEPYHPAPPAPYVAPSEPSAPPAELPPP